MKPKRLDVAILALLALVVFHARLRLAVLDPTNIGWMQVQDWSNHLQGWSFYRWDSWRFPIGYFSNLLHPVGSSTGLTDSIPWLALLGKILEPWLPHPFQYFGFYLLLCFFLQGLLGFKVMLLLSQDRLHSLVSAALLMVAPVLLDRINHIALCSQWMILALILWNVSSAGSPESTAACRRKATLLNLLAAVTHPYLWVMTFLMSLPLFAQFLPPLRGKARMGGSWRQALVLRTPHPDLPPQGGKEPSRARSFLAWVLLQLVLAGVGWWAFGYLVLGSVSESGFGIYSGRIIGFFDSAGRTALTPQITVGQPASEGFDFIGLGIALVLAMLLAASAKRLLSGDSGNARIPSGPWRVSSPYFPLLVITTGLWLYSLARFTPLFQMLGPLAAAFRAAGRFSWPLYYCVVIFLLWRYRRAFPSRAATGVLLLLLSLQVYDLKPYWGLYVPPMRPIPSVGADPFWREAGREFRHLVLWPQGTGKLCGTSNLFGPEQVQAFINCAADQFMTINVGVVSRPPRAEIKAACMETQLTLSEDRPRPDTLYVLHPDMLPPEAVIAMKNFSCHEIDGFQVCAAAPFDPRRSTETEFHHEDTKITKGEKNR